MFGAGGPGPMPSPFSPTGMFSSMSTSSGVPQRFRSESTFRTSGGRYGFQRESRVTTTINGVTQSKWIRVDSDGNEHMTITRPDGTEIYTINGIQQLSQPQLDTGERFIQPVPGDIHGDGYPRPPLITGPPPSPPPPRHHSREYDSPYNSGPVYPDRHEHGYGGERESKKWWQVRR